VAPQLGRWRTRTTARPRPEHRVVRRWPRAEAWDGEASVSAAKEQRPDLILMDIQLPHMDGYEATRRIKADPELKNIPIIAVTSYALSGDDGKAHAAGCDGYVTKPYSPRELLAKIRNFLQ
jgi:two-component system, cell cycle response regulator DivK